MGEAYCCSSTVANMLYLDRLAIRSTSSSLCSRRNSCNMTCSTLSLAAHWNLSPKTSSASMCLSSTSRHSVFCMNAANLKGVHLPKGIRPLAR